MAAFDPPRYSLLSLLTVTLFAAIISSVNTTAANTAPVSSVPGRNPLSSTIDPPDATGDKKASYPSVAEGGPILISTLSQHGSIEDISESNKPDEAKTRENAPKERYASRAGSVVARKGVEEKIKARKGVEDDIEPTKDIDQYMDLEKNNVSSNQTENMKVMKSNPTTKTYVKLETSNINNQTLHTIDPHPNGLNHSINSNGSLVLTNGTIFHPAIMNNVTERNASHIEKHIPKPKPTVTTVDGPEINESIPLSRMKNPPLGMPRKIDYIVPVIITIVALPILGAVIFVLYRRGRDCWDKRHYRRMDFLIDGMYND